MTDVSKMSDRELDEALADALGFDLGAQCCPKSDDSHTVRDHWGSPDYASDGNAMLSLIEKMRERGWNCNIDGDAVGSRGGVRGRWTQVTFSLDRSPYSRLSASHEIGSGTPLSRTTAEAAYLAIMSEVKA